MRENKWRKNMDGFGWRRYVYYIIKLNFFVWRRVMFFLKNKFLIYVDLSLLLYFKCFKGYGLWNSFRFKWENLNFDLEGVVCSRNNKKSS